MSPMHFCFGRKKLDTVLKKVLVLCMDRGDCIRAEWVSQLHGFNLILSFFNVVLCTEIHYNVLPYEVGIDKVGHNRIMASI